MGLIRIDALKKNDFVARFRRRFREDYQFAMILLFGSLAALVVSGFVVYRFVEGNLLGGTVNLAIVVGMLMVLVYVVNGGDAERGGRLFAVVTVAACIASTILFGRTGILWGYVVLWVNFLLTGRRFALTMNLVLVVFLILENRLFESILEGITYIVTALLITIFAYIFASRLALYQRQLETLALQDPLTYSGNRRMLRRDLTAAVSAFRRDGSQFAIMLLDLDDFKRVNDTLGHDVGDRALCDFADLFRSNIRAEDRFYRFGGEEFVLLIPDHGQVNALDVGWSLHERISGKLQFDGQPLRFSAGVAILKHGEDWPEWLARADRAMYQAKRDGRNCVCLAGDDAPIVRRPPISAATGHSGKA
ncbi:MAG: GGDEF domain-containing protein [Xanthomonadaceae bacterium]|nr:GGDEF domain-containing protein [Xanthomonadaceae bacterium]